MGGVQHSQENVTRTCLRNVVSNRCMPRRVVFKNLSSYHDVNTTCFLNVLFACLCTNSVSSTSNNCDFFCLSRSGKCECEMYFFMLADLNNNYSQNIN